MKKIITQEDKRLLLQDLCARLPYEAKCLYKDNMYEILGYLFDKVNIARPILSSIKWVDVELIKLYLRPMSSMTREEGDELFQLMGNGCDSQRVDFYNSHYLDFRGLIEKGLALEAPEGMYN